MSTSITFDQALSLAQQLSPADQARLVSRLVTELAVARQPAAPEAGTVAAWTRLLSLSAEMREAYPNAPHVAAQLEADRRNRDMISTEQVESSDVHS